MLNISAALSGVGRLILSSLQLVNTYLVGIVGIVGKKYPVSGKNGLPLWFFLLIHLNFNSRNKILLQDDG